MARRVRSVGLIRRLRARFGAQLRRCGGLVAALRLVEWFGGWLGDVFGLGLLAVFGGAAVRCRAAARSGSGEGGERADARERVVEVLLPGPAGWRPLSFTTRWIPKRPASDADNNNPASLTKRCSSNTTAI